MADAARYHRLQLLLALLGLGISLAYLLAALLTGAGHAVAYWAARATSARWGQIALVALLLGAGHGALGLPVTLLRSYWLPRRFGLLHQALGGWLADRLKAMLIGGALGLAAVELVYALLELTPLWWLVAAAVFFAARIALTAVLPVWIVPLFYRLVPLADDRRRRVAPPTLRSWVSAARDGSSSSIRSSPISHRRRSSRCSPTSWATMSTATSVAGSSSRVC